MISRKAAIEVVQTHLVKTHEAAVADGCRPGCNVTRDQHVLLHRFYSGVVDVLTDDGLQLNAWRELGEEMARIVASMGPNLRADLLPDWFDERLGMLRTIGRVEADADRKANAAAVPPPAGVRDFGDSHPKV